LSPADETECPDLRGKMILGLLVAVRRREDEGIGSGWWRTNFDKVPSWILEGNHPGHGDLDQLPAAV